MLFQMAFIKTQCLLELIMIISVIVIMNLTIDLEGGIKSLNVFRNLYNAVISLLLFLIGCKVGSRPTNSVNMIISTEPGMHDISCQVHQPIITISFLCQNQ